MHDVNTKSTDSWVDEINVIRASLAPYKERGSAYIEYNIPRMGKRVDVISLIDNVVFVIEFKTENTDKFSVEARRQVWNDNISKSCVLCVTGRRSFVRLS